jgi:hypothetical protein
MFSGYRESSKVTIAGNLVRIFLALAFAGPGCNAFAQEIAIAAQFEEAGNFHRGVAPVLVDKRWGLIDRRGDWVVRPRYAKMLRGGDGLFGVQEDGKWGFVSAAGQTVIGPKFDEAEAFENGAAAVKANGRWGYLRPDGTMETDIVFLEIGGREGAYVSARDPEGWAVFKLSGAGPPQRENMGEARRAFSVSEGTVIGQLEGGEGLFIILPTSTTDTGYFVARLFPREESTKKYVSIRRMSDGFAPVATSTNRWGYLHKASGQLVWPDRFEDAQSFAAGFAPVKLRGKWGYIDRAGHIAVEPAYDMAYPFRGNYAVIRQGEKRGFLRLDPQGGISVFIPPQYEDAFRFTEGLAPVKIGGRWGYVSDGQPWSELVDSGTTDIRPQ